MEGEKVSSSLFSFEKKERVVLIYKLNFSFNMLF